ncbi:MAG TPA: tetratricopeptide repeat protein, partial [Polyangiaceae bacterium]|nr:tetratricopeptide repeat protein [Polyangiaceae bacterium]
MSNGLRIRNGLPEQITRERWLDLCFPFVSVSDSPEDPTDLACELLERARRARDEGRPAAAVQDARRALTIFLRHDGPRSGDAANVLIEISAAEHDRGRFDAALDAGMRAWRIVAPVRSRDEVVQRLRMIVLAQLSVVHVARGEYTRARRVSVRVLALAERLGPDDVAGAAMGLGVACKHAGKYDEAERAYARVSAV